MPLYDHVCEKGHKFEKFTYLDDLDVPVRCRICRTIAKRIISQGHGGTHGEEAAWINESNVALTSKFQKPVRTRSEWKQRVKEKGLNPVG